MNTSLKIRLTLVLILLGCGIYLHRNPEAVERAAAWAGLSRKIDTLVVLYESSDVPKYGPKNHPGWSAILGGASLKDTLKANGVKLIGPLDKDITGKFPAGIAEAITKSKTQAMPRSIGLSKGKVVFDTPLPETEAELIKKAGG
jgi:hypothetical protein